MAQVHARIPLPTPAERQAHEVALAERDRRFWDGLRDMFSESARGMDGVAANATASAAADRAGADDAAAKATAAADRAEHWRRSEDAPRGRAIDAEKIARAAGWTTADINHARVLAQLPENSLWQPDLQRV